MEGQFVLSSNRLLAARIGPFLVVVGAGWFITLQWVLGAQLVELLLPLALLLLGAVLLLRGWEEVLLDVPGEAFVIRDASPSFTSPEVLRFPFRDLTAQKLAMGTEAGDEFELEVRHREKTVWTLGPTSEEKVDYYLMRFEAVGIRNLPPDRK